MKRLVLAFFMLLPCLIARAALPPLNVAITNYDPPFVFQTMGSKFYGFDITIAATICQQLQRNCQFIPMANKDLVTALVSNRADIALSSLTINPQSPLNYSIPYLPSKSLFLEKTGALKQPFSINFLKNKRIGIEAGTIFSTQLQQLGVASSNIVSYPYQDDMIEALSLGKIDLALLDAETAYYWHNSSSGELQTIGPTLPFGNGYGIAVNPRKINLLKQINIILSNFLKSASYQQNYDMYIH